MIKRVLLLSILFVLLASCGSEPDATEPFLGPEATGNIRYSYNTDRSNDTFLWGKSNLDPSFCVYYDGEVPSGGQVKFYLDGDLEKTENIAPYDMGGSSSNSCNLVTFSPGSHTVRVEVNGVASGEAPFTVAEPQPSDPPNKARVRYTYNTDRSNDTYLWDKPDLDPSFCVFFDGDVPSGSAVTFRLDGDFYSSDSTAPYDMGKDTSDACTPVTFAPGSHIINVEIDGLLSDDVPFTVKDTGQPDPDFPPPGTSLVNVSNCSNTRGYATALPGNVSKPASLAPDGNAYVSFIDTSRRPVAVQYDYANESCSSVVSLSNIQTSDPFTASHDAPSIFVDGDGYALATYFGRYIFNNRNKPSVGDESPFVKQSTSPNDISSLGSEEDARLYNYAELHGFRMSGTADLPDGGLFIAGTDSRGRFDIRQPGGDWSGSFAKQIIDQDPYSSGSPNCDSHGYLNRFTKAVFHQGKDGNLYVIWGYAGGPKNSASPCADLRHYTEDSHELFFAYSKDGGDTWSNSSGSIGEPEPAVDCKSRGCSGGIMHYDSAFRITDQRQREYRKIWVSADGTVHIAFVRSTWCNEGACFQKDVTNPGGVMYLSFKVGDSIEEIGDPKPINPDYHLYLGGIREYAGRVYIWGLTDSSRGESGEFREYVYDPSSDSTTTNPIKSNCRRLQGDVSAPEFRSALMTVSCTASDPSERDIWLYRRDF